MSHRGAVQIMLERNRTSVTDRSSHPVEFIRFSDITLFARTHALFIMSFAILGLLGAVSYIATSAPIFTARTQILIEPKIPQLLQQQQPSEVNLSLDTSQMETQIAVLRSEKIAMMVIDELNLREHPAFMEPRGSLGERFHSLLAMPFEALGIAGNRHIRFLPGPPEAEASAAEENSVGPSKFEADRRVVGIFGRGLKVNRVGVSYAIDIYFESQDPELAARIANATAEAFVREQLETRTETASEGLRWLEARIEEVRTQMNRTTQLAQAFRARHDYRIGASDPSEDGQGERTGPTLEELEVTAETYRKMYESLLAAFTSSVNQQPYLIADARVITKASRPLSQSHPRKALTMAFGLTAGLMLGVGGALARHLLDRTLRTPRQVPDELGLECVGELPAVSFKRGGFGRFDEVTRRPGSEFSRSLKSAKAAIARADITRPLKLIGLTSALPSDGKSTVASNLAALYAQSGFKTLLIDADMQNCVLTTELTDAPVSTDSAEGEPGEAKVIPIMNGLLDLLPCSASMVRKLTSAKDMPTALKRFDCYEKIVVDLPPFTSHEPGLAACPLLDGVVVVAEWGGTPLDLLAELSRTLQAANASVIGVLMTRVRTLSSARYQRRARQSPR